MEQLYQDIINMLNPKKTSKYTEIQNNRAFKNTLELIKQLLKIIKTEEMIIIENPNIKSLEKIRETKNVLIRKIKIEINKINKEHHLHINKIIEDEVINRNELEFSLRLLYQDSKIEEQIKAAKEYKHEQYEIDFLERLIRETHKIPEQIINHICKIKNIKRDENKISVLIHKLFKSKPKEELEEQKIIKGFLNKTRSYREIEDICSTDIDKIKNIIETINEQNELDYDKLEKEIKGIYKLIEIKLKTEVSKKQKEQVKKSRNIHLNRNQLNDITNINNNTYSYKMVQPAFIKQTDKKETLLVKSLLTLRLIDIIENNEINILDKLEENNEIREVENNQRKR